MPSVCLNITQCHSADDDNADACDNIDVDDDDDDDEDATSLIFKIVFIKYMRNNCDEGGQGFAGRRSEVEKASGDSRVRCTER